MLDKLAAIEAKYSQIEARLGVPETYDDPALVAKLNQEQTELQPLVETFRAYQQTRAEKEEAEVLLSELEDCIPAAPSAEEVWEAREVAAAIDRWLDGLDRESRALFVRRYWYGDRVDELAARWGRTPNGTAQRLRRLRAGLRRALEREGVIL